jgi:hypothetical protein
MKGGRKLGEDLFLSKFGVELDEVKVLSTFIHKHNHLKKGISKNSVWIKFWSQKKVYKGIVDIENEMLYIKEPIPLTMHTGELIPVWKDVTAVHRNGLPKKEVFHDADERPRGVVYLDKEGCLKRGSWRRYKGIEVYCFSSFSRF